MCYTVAKLSVGLNGVVFIFVRCCGSSGGLEKGGRDSFACDTPSSFCRMRNHMKGFGWVGEFTCKPLGRGAGLQSLCEHSLCGYFVLWQK